ncbi:hypothetical protein GUG60_14265, partial [Xanthomonas citri pv. citri]|nr:hypothetical protein [Xanthomonas citri pv. citri]
SIWPHVEERIVDLVAERRSTLVFANSRRLAERLTGRLNEIWEARAEAAAAAEHPDAVPGFRTPGPTGFHGPAQVAGQTGTGSGTVSDFARAH